MKKNPYKIILSILILVIVIIAVQYRKNIIENNKNIDEINNVKLGSIRTIDWKGREINTDNIKNKYIYIQFIDRKYKTDIEYLKYVINDWQHEDMEYFIFAEDVQSILKEINDDMDNINIINKEIVKYSNMISGTNKSSYCYLYDKNNNFVSRYQTETPYKESIYIDLKRIFLNKQFSFQEMFGDNNIYKTDFNNIIKDSFNPNAYKIIIFLSRYCDGCIEKTIINQMQILQKKQKVDNILILYNSFNDYDKERIKKYSEISFPIIIASKENKILEKWNKMIEEYSSSSLTMIIIIFNKNGDVINEYYNGCKCMENVQKIMKKIYENGEI